MRPSRRDIVIATRRSKLAVAQSQAIGRWLAQLNPRVGLRLVTLESEGDRVLDHPLAAVGGKGLFTGAIEQALLDGSADIAVHSLKDLPSEATPGLVIAAIPARMPPHDVLICREGGSIEGLAVGATVGTCSPRRHAQLRRLRGDLKITPMRGNVDTRLRKVLEEQRFDATLLAAAGLLRLGLEEHTSRPIPMEQVLPAAGQGALAVQCRVDDHLSLRRCMPLNDATTSLCVHAERQIVADLGADCHSPLAVLAQPGEDDRLRLRARVLSHDGSTCLEADETAPAKSIPLVCRSVVKKLLDRGARHLLDEAEQIATPAPTQ